MGKVSIDVATKEVNEWVASKKFSESKKESLKDSIDSLIKAVADGTLAINEDKTINHELKFEVGADFKVKSFTYKHRLAQGEITKRTEGLKPTDADGRICAYIAALTGEPKSVILQLDTEDYSVAQSIAVFFI
jgi:hypothetical protein